MLAYKGQLPSGRQRADLQRVEALLGSGEGASPAPSPAPPGLGAPAAVRKQQLGDLQQQKQQQQHQAHPLEQHTPRRAAPPQPRNTADLLALLDGVPDGQPFEIDARLLYSPEPSVSGSAHSKRRQSSSLAGSSSAYASVDAEGWQQPRQSGGFTLPAYRPATQGAAPLVGDLGAAAFLLSPLQPPSAPRGRRQQQAWTPERAAVPEGRDFFSPSPVLQRQRQALELGSSAGTPRHAGQQQEGDGELHSAAVTPNAGPPPPEAAPAGAARRLASAPLQAQLQAQVAALAAQPSASEGRGSVASKHGRAAAATTGQLQIEEAVRERAGGPAAGGIFVLHVMRLEPGDLAASRLPRRAGERHGARCAARPPGGAARSAVAELGAAAAGA